ncbi:Fc receptor-like protein 5 [Myripristis murdjan]|uniref:Fc receptor-like protein 5 n=1 Tax=Myripristis murdjan TaxID=586833 RepID=UPI0011762CBB|nr:Fc receptor-like protein 5 [Myripristis murdjan]
MFAFFVVVLLGLCYCSKESSANVLGRPELDGPSVALLGDIVDFQCEVLIYPEDENIQLQIFKEGDRSKVLAEYTSMSGEMAVMPLLIISLHEGYLECEASVLNDSRIQPTVSYRHYLQVIEPVDGAEVVVQSGAVEFFEGKTLKLLCNLTAGNHVSYSWLLNGQPVSHSPLHYTTGSQLFVHRPTSQDSGSYMCVATNQFNMTRIFTSNSSEVLITVKDVVSNPDISFTVLKEATDLYYAVVTCQSTKGTPPITFSLYNIRELVENMTVNELSAEFAVQVVLGQHLGWIQCQAYNGDQTAYSEWKALEVVPVQGPVTMHYDYDVGEDFAVIGLRIYCKVAKGSHPRYQWFLNETLLEGRGTFYVVVDQPQQQSILLISVGRSSAGTYHCEASDSFESLDTAALRSKKWYLDKEVLNRLPISVVAAVFGCFSFLVSLVSICCCVGVVYRRKQYAGESVLDMRMKRVLVAYEDELDLDKYREDVDMANATRIDDSDQASVASADEWPLIEEERKTLEDEPDEGSQDL